MKTNKTKYNVIMTILLIFITIFTFLIYNYNKKPKIEIKQDILNQKSETSSSLSVQKNNISSKPTIKTPNIISEEITNDSAQTVISPIKTNINTENYQFYYNQLNNEDKKNYDLIVKGLINYQNIIDIKVTNKNNIKKIYNYIRMDNPQIFYMPFEFTILSVKKNNKIYNMQLKLKYDSNFDSAKKIRIIQNKINDKTDEILKNIKNLDDYNKLLLIYSWLATNNKYITDNEYDYTIYGILIKNEGSCQGFSATFQYLLNKLNYESIIVTGKANDTPHQWNLVNVNNKWYYFDPTWDTPINTDKYLHYAYFGLTLDDIKNTHIINNLNILPIANSVDMNYFYKNNLILKNTNIDSITDVSLKSYLLNKNHISFRCLNKEIYNTIINDINTWLSDFFEENNIVVNNISYIKYDDLYFIDIYFS